MTPKVAMQQALTWMEWYDFDTRLPEPDFDVAITALREALAERAEQEPVAWMNAAGAIHKHKLQRDWTPLYAAPVRTKDPCNPLQDLTDDEIVDCAGTLAKIDLKFARAVIAALREKNRGN